MDEIVAALLAGINIDLSKFSPNVQNFIYAAVAEDRLPLGEIIERARQNPDDAAALDAEFEKIKALLPDAVAALPWHIRMAIEPALKMLNK